MAELKIERVKYIPLAMSGCMLLAVTLPYIVTVIQQKVELFLPYISHAAAFPPQSGFLSIFMAIAATFGVPTFFLRFVIVDHKRNKLEPKKIRILNMVAVGIGCLAVIAMLFSSHYPVGYVTHETKDWMQSVVIPHFTCTALVLTLFTVYVLIEAYLTYVQRKRSTKNVFIHATLSMCVVITTWTSCIPFYAAIREMSPRIINSETGEISLETTEEYSFYYIISSLSEWAFTLFSILFLATYYRDFKRMTVSLKVIKKSEIVETNQFVSHAITNGHHDEITKM